MTELFEPLFKINHEGRPEAPWFTLNTLLEFYDTIERISIKNYAMGGLGFS